MSDDAEMRTAVISLYRREDKVQPRSVRGWFAGWRWALVWLTQLVFYGLPWLTWNGRSAVLFDLEARRFYIFELVLYPQDFIYLTGLLVISACALFLFTAVAGRVWCGFACPQTVYTEVFMWVERRFEGDRNQRLKLDAAPWTWPKLLRKGGKHAVWGAIGLWTGLSFVGYFTPMPTLLASAATFTLGPWEAFWVLFYGLATYGNAGWMREQVCKYMCPYARFQSAMFDPHTLIVGYDMQRGEPRGGKGQRARGMDPQALRAARLGDCIDCGLCVQVCPTGIDIRKGLQYECIACAACVDVCNGVMDKMHYARGLIRYDTQAGLQQPMQLQARWSQLLRPRVLVYGAALLAIGAALVVSLALRMPFKVDVVRDRGTLARTVDDGWIENVYRLQIMNATETAQHYRVSGRGLPGLVADSRGELTVGPAQARWVAVALRMPPQQAAAAGAGSHRVQFVIEQTGAEPRTLTEKATFMVPR